MVSNQAWAFAITEQTRLHVGTDLERMDEILNVVLSLLAGREHLVLLVQSRCILAGLVTVSVVLLARRLSVAGLFNMRKQSPPLPRGAIPLPAINGAMVQAAGLVPGPSFDTGIRTTVRSADPCDAEETASS